MEYPISKAFAAAALDGSEILLLVFGLLLTVGVLGEYKKFPRYLKGTHQAFELLVVIGIAGELVADGGVFLSSRRLQTINDVEVALLNKKAGDAALEAGHATERAEKTASDNLLLQERIVDRRLSVDQIQRVRDKMRSFGPPIAWQLVVFSVGDESIGLSNDIEDALVGDKGAQWPPPNVFTALSSKPIRGIVVEFCRHDPGASFQGMAVALAQALTLEGLRNVSTSAFVPLDPLLPSKSISGVMTWGGSPSPDSPITLIVGRKP